MKTFQIVAIAVRFVAIAMCLLADQYIMAAVLMAIP